MGGRGIDTWLCVWCVCYMYLHTLHTHIGVMQIGTPRIRHSCPPVASASASCQLQKEKSEKGKLYAV